MNIFKLSIQINFKTILFLLIFFFWSSSYSVHPESIPTSNSLDFKIGQMIMLGFRGLEIDVNHPIVQDIRDLHIGGVILFDVDVPNQSPVRNIQSPDQLRKLTYKLQTLAPTPLLIAIDYEGGNITRLKEKFGFPPTLSAAELGEKDDLTFTRIKAKEMAKTLNQMGINLNLAPVMDLNSNPQNPIIGKLERSYGSNPEIVIKQATAFIQAHHEHDILCALKHFPGHGSSVGDTHKGVVDITETWSEMELIPFQQLIRSGNVDAILTAHLINRHIDPELPSTLSYPTITGILRNQLGYDGVMISDDLQMKAIRENFDLETTIYQTIHAGVDILLFANNSVYEEDIGIRIIQIIRKLILKEILTEKRIHQSYRRIQKLKKQMTGESFQRE
jgi:beta-N-acetylhexosaminidase